MRLREIKEIVDEVIDDIQIEVKNTANNEVEIQGITKTIDSMLKLSSLGFLENELKELKLYPRIFNFRPHDDKILLSPNSYAAIKKIIEIAAYKTYAVQDILNLAIPEQNINSISVKLPNYDDLNDITKFFEELNKALKLALSNDSAKSEVKIQAFDSGSLWVEIFVGSGLALHLLGQITKAAATVSKEYFIMKKLQLDYKRESHNVEFEKQLNEFLLHRIQTLAKSEASIILDNNISLTDKTEYSGKLEKSIEIMAKLINEGTRIQPALKAPESTIEKFPDQKQLNEIESQVRQLQGLMEIDSPEDVPNDLENDPENN